MPGCRERPGLRLAVANCYGDDEIGIVEGCSVGVRDGVAQFTALVNGTRRLGCAVRANASGEGELPEELEQARFVATFVRINLGVVTLEVAIGECGWSAMARARDVHHIQVVLLNQTIQVYPEERL